MNTHVAYTPVEIAAITAAIVTILGAFGAMIVTILRGIKELKEKVNGAHTKQQEVNKALQDKVDSLHVLLAEKKQDVALLEQAAATQAALPPSPMAPSQPPAEVVIVNTPHDPVPTVTTKPK